MKTLYGRAARTLRVCVGTILVVGSFSSFAPVFAQSPESYYQGKRISLVVGYGPGGGFDTNARIMAPYLERATGAEVIVENRPGGGGLVALNQLYDGRDDDLTIMLVNARAAVMAQLLHLDGVRFKLDRLPWLSRLNGEPSVALVGPRSGFSSIDDLKKAAPVKWAGSGKTDSLADSAACISEALGLDSRIIIGYKGAKESGLAVLRGEADAIVASAGTARKLAKSGLKPLVVLARNRASKLPDVPSIFELVDLAPERAWWIDFWAGMSELGRAFAMAPEAPAERIGYLSGVLATILDSEAFRADMAKSGYEVAPMHPDGIRSLVATTLDSLADGELERLEHVVFDKYY